MTSTADSPSLGDVATAGLHVRALDVTYGGVRAVTDLDLDVAPGQVIGLIGPNGAGKTSAIDAITGYARASAGVISMNGVDLRTMSPDRRARAGLVRTFQQLELFDDLTVEENCRVAGRACGTADAGAVAKWLAFLEIEHLGGQLARGLPAGVRRLVAVARALAQNPRTLLLDEPAAGLDSSESTRFAQHLRELVAPRPDGSRLGILLVDHDMSLVLSVSDHVVVLEYGAIIAEGRPESVKLDERVIRAVPGRRVMVLLRVDGLEAGYGVAPVLRDVDLTVDSGEIVALVGPNGAGKTTLLSAIAGFVRPSRGEIIFDGDVINRVEPHVLTRRRLQFVPDDRALLRSLTVAENLKLIKHPVLAADEIFPELRGLMNRSAGLLSGGEQQMLALARALATKPRLLMVDELSMGLAPMIVNRLLSALTSSAEQGMGVLLVEQHVPKALAIASRAYVMVHGEITLSGPASELLQQRGRLEAAYLAH